MKIGIPREIKDHEYRVALTPAGANALTNRGHPVIVQSGAGEGSGFRDDAYSAVGAEIVTEASDAWAAEMVLKVKEPITSEYSFLRPDLTLFTYLHLAANRPLTEALLSSGTTAIAYETVQHPDGSLPLLTPMSEVAGRLAPLEGAHHLRAAAGGRGILLPGVPGAGNAKVTVIGGGAAGLNAARVALGLGAEVTVMDVSLPRLREIDLLFDGAIRTLASSEYEIAHEVAEADLIIGAVLVTGSAAPRVVTDEMVKTAKPGAVFVDIAVDQGGCFEGSQPTTHYAPTFSVHGAIYYCVANMPGAVPVTSTSALTNATLPYVLKTADKGWEAASDADLALGKGVNTTAGKLLSSSVAESHGMPASAE